MVQLAIFDKVALLETDKKLPNWLKVMFNRIRMLNIINKTMITELIGKIDNRQIDIDDELSDET